MKLIYGGVPYNTTKVKHYEVSTNDCDMEAYDLQAGRTGVAKGRKIVGTGKAFEFASYGYSLTNLPLVIPTEINTVQISSVDYPIRTIVPVYDTNLLDFSTPQTIAEVVIEKEVYPLIVSVQNGTMIVACDHTINIELFYGKDRYI